MAGIWPGHDLALEFAAVVIEGHVEKLRADPRPLSRRALCAKAPEHRADISESRRAERRPAQQPRAEEAERDCHRELTLDAGKGGGRKRDNAAADLDRACKHNRVGCTKHLQQRVKNNNGDDAGDQGSHEFYIVGSAVKSMPVPLPKGGGERKAPWRQPHQLTWRPFDRTLMAMERANGQHHDCRTRRCSECATTG